MARPQSILMDDLGNNLGNVLEMPASSENSPAEVVGEAVGNATASVLEDTPLTVSTVTNNLVFAHHIVGNTYNYTVNNWATGES